MSLMENDQACKKRDIQQLQDRVIELERQLAEAQAAVRTSTGPHGAEPQSSPAARAQSRMISEEHFHRALFMAPYPLMIRRDDGKVVMINEAWTEITGYTLDDIPTIEQWTQKAYGQLAAGRQSIITKEGFSQHRVKKWGEVEVTTRAGKSRIWDFSTAPLGLDDCGRELVMVMAVDVTERKQSEEGLRTTRDEAMWLARLPGENPNPVARVSDEGMVLYCNLQAAGLPGWRCEINEPLPMPLRRLVPQALTEGRLVEQDVLLDEKIYAVSVVPILNEGYANIYGRDVTQHRKAEQALKESERRQREMTRLLELDQARLAAVLRHLPVGVWIIDKQGRLTGNNPEADRIWAGEAPLLNSIAEFQKYVSWHAESGKLLGPEEYPVAVALRTGEPVDPLEINIRRFDGSEGTVLASAAPIKDSQGFLMGVVGVNVEITDRKRMEEALRRSEERLAKAFHATPDAIVISRMSDGLILEANEGWRKLFGHDPQEVIGQTSIGLGIYVNPEDRQEIIIRLQEKGFLHDFQIQLRRKSGEVRQASMFIERIEIQGVTCLLTILRDITDRKQAEQALLEGARRLNRAQEIAHLGSWELDLVNNRLTWSDEVYRIFGLAPQQFAATYEAFLEAVHPEDRAAVDAAYSGSIQAGRDSYEIEHRIVRRSTGEVRIVHEKCEHFRDQDGRIVRSAGMVHDITERKHAEQALQKSEERFRSLADSMPQLVWTALTDGTVDYYNQRYRQYWGLKQIEAASWEWAPALHPDDLDATLKAWKHSLETGEIYQIEHRVRMVDGSYRWHLSRGVPILDEKGHIVHWFGTATDIHDLRLAEEELGS
jgi:PAS domain S-box-containing protein